VYQQTPTAVSHQGRLGFSRTIPMDASVHRRLTVAVCWALARRSALDTMELYEESFALSEEFREWLVALDQDPDVLKSTMLMVPKDLTFKHWPETDGLLEI
jgi:hypothetical protein